MRLHAPLDRELLRLPSPGRPAPSPGGGRPSARGRSAARRATGARRTRRRCEATGSVSRIEILVADLHVVLELRGVVAALRRSSSASAVATSPAVRSRTVRSSTESATSRPSRITWTKRASGRRALDQLHLLHVGRASSRPSAACPGASGVGLVERADGGPGLELRQRVEAMPSISSSEISKSPHSRWSFIASSTLSAGSALGLRGLDHVGDEVGLGRDRQLRDGRRASSAGASCPSGSCRPRRGTARGWCRGEGSWDQDCHSERQMLRGRRSRVAQLVEELARDALELGLVRRRSCPRARPRSAPGVGGFGRQRVSLAGARRRRARAVRRVAGIAPAISARRSAAVSW